MELLDDVCHMESRLGLFRNSVSFGARDVGSTCWYFGEEAQVETRFYLFGDSANLGAR